MKLFETMARIFDLIVDGMAFIAGLFSIAIMVLICYLVIMRYIFSSPPAWILEICEYLLIYITFLSATWLLRKNGHVRVDLFLSWLSEYKQKVMRVFTSVVGGLSCAILTWFSLMVTLDNFSRNILSIQTLSIPKWILYAIIPIGALLMTLEFFRQAFTKFQLIRKYPHDTQTKSVTEKGV
ncbi:TRAP transporter small permease [Desulfocicer niacini]